MITVSEGKRRKHKEVIFKVINIKTVSELKKLKNP